MHLLRTRKIPLWQEFSPSAYKTKGTWKDYLSVIKSCYQFYIDWADICEGNEIRHSIDDLELLAREFEQGRKEIQRTDIFIF